MKITGTSSYVLVELEGRVVKIKGELLQDGFAADPASIGYWEAPLEHIMIKPAEKEDLIKKVNDYTQDKPFKIFWD